MDPLVVPWGIIRVPHMLSRHDEVKLLGTHAGLSVLDGIRYAVEVEHDEAADIAVAVVQVGDRGCADTLAGGSGVGSAAAAAAATAATAVAAAAAAAAATTTARHVVFNNIYHRLLQPLLYAIALAELLRH